MDLLGIRSVEWIVSIPDAKSGPGVRASWFRNLDCLQCYRGAPFVASGARADAGALVAMYELLPGVAD